jgi:hypothetical protein
LGTGAFSSTAGTISSIFTEIIVTAYGRKCQNQSVSTSAQKLSYPRKRISRDFFPNVILNSPHQVRGRPAGLYPGENRGRNDNRKEMQTRIDSKLTYLVTPRPAGKGGLVRK